MKRFFAGAMAVAVMLTTAACSSEQPSSDERQTNQTEETTADNAATNGDTFVIGGIGPLTGGAASYGNSVKQGAQIAVDEINEAGGVTVGDKTYQLALNFQDDQGKEDVALTTYNSLMDGGINALIGTVTSAPCIAIKDVVSADGILQITPSGSAIDCITDADNAFRLCFTDPLQGVTMADFAVNDLGKKNIAVIYNAADDYSAGMKDAFEEEVSKLGGTIVASEAFNTEDVDFATQLTTIKGADAEIIFVPAYYEPAAKIAQQAKEMGVELPLIGGDGWDGILGQVADPAAIEGAIFLSPFLASDPAVAPFVTAYEGKYNATPDQFAADGYDTVYVIKAAMEQAGSVESADLISAMTQIEVAGMTGNIKFNADGEPDKGAKFVQVKDGQYTAYTAGQ